MPPMIIIAMHINHEYILAIWTENYKFEEQCSFSIDYLTAGNNAKLLIISQNS